MRDDKMNKGNNSWNKDAGTKGNQNTNKQNAANLNKGSQPGQQNLSSHSGESRYDTTHREQGKDFNKGQHDQRNIGRDGQKYNNQTSGKIDKDTNRKIDHDKRKAG